MVTKASNQGCKFSHLALGLVLALSLVACGSDNSTSAQSSAMTSNTTEPFIMNGVPVTMVLAGAEYRYQPTANNPSGRVLAYNVVNKPDWAIFSEATGELSGTPQESDVGISGNIEIGVSDGTTTATVGPFRIRVIRTKLDTTAAVSVSGTPAGSVTAGQEYRFLPVVANPGGEALSFSIINRPTWTTFNTATGLLVGTPKSDNAGTYSNITISVSTQASPVSLAPFTIRVQAAGSDAPTISGSPPTTVAAGGSYSFTPTAGNPGGNALTFSVMNTPSWASFNASTGELAGIAPSGSSAQLYSNIVISVSDGTNSASLAPFSIEVEGSSGGGGGHHNLRFHPGYYVELDQNASLASNLASIDSLRGAANVAGVALIMNWANMEFAEGVYTGGTPGDQNSAQGFYAVDLLLQHCQAAHLQLILGYEDRVFGTNRGYYGNGAFVPPYMDRVENGSPGYLTAAAGTTWTGDLIAVVDVTNSQAWAREVALGVAYASRYNSNPNFEMFRSPETSIAEFNSTGQDDIYFANYLLWMQQIRAVAPSVGLSISTNFTAGVTNPNQFSTFFAHCQTYGVSVGGPDVWYSNANSNPYLGYDNLVFNGYTGEPQKKWNNILAFVAENQYGDINSALSPSYLSQLYTFLFSGAQSGGGGVTPNYWLIDQGQPGPGWSVAAVADWIGAAAPLNMTRPASY